MRACVGIALLLFLIPAGAGAQTPWPPRPASETEPSGKIAERFRWLALPRPVVDADASDPTLAGWARSETAAQHGNGAEKSRVRQYLWDMAGPGTLAGASLKAGIDHLRDVPQEWDQTHGGYGRRLASVGGRFAVQTTVTHGLAAVMDRQTTYPRCECSGRGRRLRHALLGTVTDLREDGRRTLAVPRMAGAYAGAFAQLAWHPGKVDAGDALKSGTAFVVSAAIQNLAREFLGARIPILAH